jgi:hypothetical protein
MSELSRKDALLVMEQNNISPIVTHDLFKPIANQPRGIDTNDIIKIYQLGGYISVPVSGYSLEPKKMTPYYKNILAKKENYVPLSIDNYEFVYTEVQNFINRNCGLMLLNDSLTSFSQLSESNKTKLSIGYQSDFNGWLNHSKPKYATKKQQKKSDKESFTEFDKIGLAHPGMIEAHWKELERNNIDLTPIKRSTERFLQLWQNAIDYSTFEVK